MHKPKSYMTIDPRVFTMPGRIASGLFRGTGEGGGGWGGDGGGSRSLTELTRQITAPTKNGRAPPRMESRKSSQSVGGGGRRRGGIGLTCFSV